MISFRYALGLFIATFTLAGCEGFRAQKLTSTQLSSESAANIQPAAIDNFDVVIVGPSTLYTGDTPRFTANVLFGSSLRYNFRWTLNGSLIGSNQTVTLPELTIEMNQQILRVEASSGSDRKTAEVRLSIQKRRLTNLEIFSRTEYIVSLYRTVLGREPSQEEVTAWQYFNLYEGDITCSQMATNFLQSPEFVEKNRLLDSTTFLRRLYLILMRREADAQGLESWGNWLRTGVFSRQAVAEAFLKSAEFDGNCKLVYGFKGAGKYRFITLLDSPIDSDLLQMRLQFITLLYQRTLGREPDPSGISSWQAYVSNLGGAQCAQTALGFLRSPEFVARLQTLSVEAM